MRQYVLPHPLLLSRHLRIQHRDLQDSFETCPPLDIVLIGASFQPEISDTELAFVRKSYQECSAFITVCGGIEVPLKAGILEGKTATAPRLMLQELRQRATGTQWVERRWARDGKLWTSGMLLNGLDLMHNFIRATWPSGEGSLMDFTAKACAWPNRDPEYGDVSWEV